MTHGFGWLRRIAALSAAISLLTSPLAAAQTTASTGPADPPAGTVLLNPAAIARLADWPRADRAPVPVTKDPPRGEVLRQSPPAGVRPAVARSAQPPRRSAGTWGQKTLVVLACVGFVVGVLAASFYTGVDFTPLLDPDAWGGK